MWDMLNFQNVRLSSVHRCAYHIVSLLNFCAIQFDYIKSRTLFDISPFIKIPITTMEIKGNVIGFI